MVQGLLKWLVINPSVFNALSTIKHVFFFNWVIYEYTRFTMIQCHLNMRLFGSNLGWRSYKRSSLKTFQDDVEKVRRRSLEIEKLGNSTCEVIHGVARATAIQSFIRTMQPKRKTINRYFGGVQIVLNFSYTNLE